MDSTKLAEINALQADKALSSTRHQEILGHTDYVAESVLSATSSLIKYLEGHTSLVEVTNQLESIATPDVKFVVEALQVLDTTIKERPLTDLSEVTGVMRELLDEAKAIPKVLPDAPELPVPVDYSKQLDGLKSAIQAVEKVVKAQKLIAEAPVVNVPETNVNVAAPDLQPLQSGLKDVVKAVSKIVIPEFKTDNKAVEKLLKDANKLLKQLIDKPVGRGGGGGSIPAYRNSSGYPDQPVLTAAGAVPVDIGSANVTINASDIEIGAVEIKDSTTDNRTSVINSAPTTEYGLVTRNIPSGTQPISASSLPLPAGAATAALQTQPGVDIGDVTVNNAAGAAAVNIQDGGNSITVDYATTGSGVATGALRVELPTNGTGTIATVGAVTAISNALPAGNNNIGDMDVASLPVAFNSGATSATTQRVILATDTTVPNVTGNVASGSSDSGNPVKTGAVGKTANPTAVTDGQRANFIADKLGKQVVVGSIRDLKVNQITTITSSTTETTVLTAVASTFLDVYGCIVVNSSAAAANVSFKDSTSGTVRFNVYVPAGDTRGFMLPESAAFAQTTVNNNWTATSSASVASLIITMLAVKNI